MAALSITVANIIPVSSATNTFEQGITNAAVPAGKAVYYDPATGLYGLFDADSATVAIHTLRGMSVTSADGTGSGIVVQTAGQCAFGAILTKGLFYSGGPTAGAIIPTADSTTNQYIHIMGAAISASVLEFHVFNTLVQI